MQFLKKSIAFLLIFSFLSSVKIFTFGSAEYSSFMLDGGQIPVNIAVLVSEDNFEEAENFLFNLCQQKHPYPNNEFLTYEYGNYREFNLNFDLLRPNFLGNSPNDFSGTYNFFDCFLKNHPLALALIDSKLEDIDWQKSMEDYLNLIKFYNKDAFIIYGPLRANELIQEIGLPLASEKLNDMARYISSYLEEVLFSLKDKNQQVVEKEQVLSVAQIMDDYIISGEFINNVYEILRTMLKRGRLKAQSEKCESSYAILPAKRSTVRGAKHHVMTFEEKFETLEVQIRNSHPRDKKIFISNFLRDNYYDICDNSNFARLKELVVNILGDIKNVDELREFINFEEAKCCLLL